MSKRTRTLVLSGIAVVVLTALLVVLLLLPPADTPDDDTEVIDTSVTLLDKSTDDDEKPITPKKVTVTYDGETYTLIADDNGNLIVEEYAALPHSENKLTYLTDELTTIVAERLVAEAPEQPQEFGFDTEKGATASVSVTYTDDSTYAFELGGTAPSGESRYLREAGKSAVYLYDETAAETFMAPSKAYLSLSPIILPSPEDSEEAASDETVIRDAELSGTVRPEPIYLQVAPDAAESAGSSVAGYLIQRPYYRSVQADSQLMTTAAYTFTASDIAVVYPTAAQLTSFGLDKPYSQCLFNLSVRHSNEKEDADGNKTTEFTYYNTFEYTVKIGNADKDGLRYAVVYLEDELLPIVYLVQESAIAWSTMQYDDIADMLLFYIYITNVDTMRIRYEGKTTVYDLQHVPDADEKEENLFVYVDGKAYDTDGFRKMYETLTGLYRSAAADQPPQGEPVFVLEIDTFKDTVRGAEIEIYQHTPSRYLIKHDTGEQYLVDARKVEEMFAKYRTFLENNQ